MGLGWHVALTREIPGVDPTAVNGKALIFRQRDLDELARQRGLTPLTHFLSVDPAALVGYFQQQGLDPDNFPIPAEDWFEPGAALTTVRGLRDQLRGDPSVLDAQRIIQDLQALEAILVAAQREQVLFHLASRMPGC